MWNQQSVALSTVLVKGSSISPTWFLRLSWTVKGIWQPTLQNISITADVIFVIIFMGKGCEEKANAFANRQARALRRASRSFIKKSSFKSHDMIAQFNTGKGKEACM